MHHREILADGPINGGRPTLLRVSRPPCSICLDRESSVRRCVCGKPLCDKCLDGHIELDERTCGSCNGGCASPYGRCSGCGDSLCHYCISRHWTERDDFRFCAALLADPRRRDLQVGNLTMDNIGDAALRLHCDRCDCWYLKEFRCVGDRCDDL